MKFFLITDDSDTAVGMRLAGVDYTIVSDYAGFSDALNKAVADQTTGIILLTQGLYSKGSDYSALVDSIKASHTVPLITEIPGNEDDYSSDAISRYVAHAVGIG